MQRKYRSRIGILYDILVVIFKSDMPTITSIVMDANIPHNRLKKIIANLIKKGYIEELETAGMVIYKLTPEGYKLMKELEKLKKLLKGLGLAI